MGASFDALSLSAARAEIEPRLVGGRVQKIVFPDEHSLALEVFAPSVGRSAVLVSAHPENGRVQLVPRLPTRGVEGDTPFRLVVRKHLRNARVRTTWQPRLERILKLECEKLDDAEQRHRMLLIVEAMGRRSNLVLVDEDGSILDALRRSPPSRNPRRPILPHLRYDDPPPQDRLFPEQVSAQELFSGARGRSGPLARYLSNRLAGLSPLAGRELAFRATGAADTPLSGVTSWSAIVDVIQQFFAPLETNSWQPTLALRDDQPIDVAPYRPEHLAAAGATLRQLPTLSDALEAYYSGQPQVRRGDPLAGERRTLLSAVDATARTTDRRIAALEQQLASGEEQRDPLRRTGELLLAYQSTLGHGLTEVELEGERIALDPHLTPVENAHAYFARYRKAREAVDRVPALLDEARQTREHLAELRTLVDVADDASAIRALRREIAAATDEPAPSKQRQAARGSYRRVPLGDGWEALIGASALGNATVTFELARPHDMWLHARRVPGAHVILRKAGQSAAPPNNVLERAAELAAWHSAARTAGRVEVDAAPRRSVKKVPGGPPGLVRYTNERTLRVSAKP